ncbi:methyltransferase family protein [Aeoliella mucimassa]|uniref:Isoprenylcysteine carboxyl methyltransferase (ICMT) family protein n=1 Tax=Aeoliella mucimassa TaxID=2527972 RepID=A0A518ASI2_9BACT|nr:isoprenylcysteine carboxylmethyltransferase family protein [Aeoliella mucimassa]QDU57694.1 Isoprenylcysteine carboxyl methyltransferase (ICMT) family protein [Aeoliella mucimassa]
MKQLPVIFAALLLLVQGLAELAAMWRTGALRRRRTPEWTFRAVNLPYRLMFVCGIVEWYYRGETLRAELFATGAALASAGVLLRVICHFQLGYHFSPYVDLAETHQLTEQGFYRVVRHPMYLGTLLILIGVPLLTASWWAAGFAVISAAGLLARVVKEERFLSQNLPGYEEYTHRTWRLVPWIW